MCLNIDHKITHAIKACKKKFIYCYKNLEYRKGNYRSPYQGNRVNAKANCVYKSNRMDDKNLTPNELMTKQVSFGIHVHLHLKDALDQALMYGDTTFKVRCYLKDLVSGGYGAVSKNQQAVFTKVAFAGKVV